MDMFIILVVVLDEYRCQNVSNCTLETGEVYHMSITP